MCAPRPIGGRAGTPPSVDLVDVWTGWPMRVEEVTFHNRGSAIVGTLKLPDGPGPFAAVVQGPG